MATFLLGAGLALAIALLVAIYRKLERLPTRAQSDATAIIALKNATAIEVATITAALRSYEEHLAEQHQQAVAGAETRARLAERRASDAGVALSAASELVRELRALIDDARGSRVQPLAEPAVVDIDDARKTVPMGAASELSR